MKTYFKIVWLILLLLISVCAVACKRFEAPVASKNAVIVPNAERGQHSLYVALGDSTGVGMGAHDRGGYVDNLLLRINRNGSKAELINVCAAGASIHDVLEKQASRLAKLRPTLVTLSVGSNDLLQETQVEHFARDYEDVVIRIKRTCNVVVITNIPSLSSAPGLPPQVRNSVRQRTLTFNRSIAEIAERYGLPLFDLYSVSESLALHPEFFSADGVHPSDRGYEFWAEAMWPLVEEAINRS